MSNDHDPLRRTVIAALASAPLLSLADTQTASEAPRSGSRILVAYFSRSGNTRVVAGLIQRGLGADLFEIRPANAYPEDYLQTVEQARQERDSDFEPKLQSKVRALNDYDTIYLGFPIWGETAPPIVRAFLSAHDLSGKTLIPFNTHGGYGLGNSRSVLLKHAPKAKVLEGFVMEGEQERKTMERVNGWLSLGAVLSVTTQPAEASQTMTRTPASAATLSNKQQTIPLIAAFMATSDMPNLNAALNQGLDAGLTVSETREILVQLYAYVGFPRSLNALNELMTVVQARKQRGSDDAPGREPSQAIPVGDELLAAGTANQTKISGGPVTGPVFEFAPVINRFLQTHLFGDIFERDNLDWQSRELATVGALAATPGVESQLRSHMAASLRVGLSATQLREVIEQLKKHRDTQTSDRANTALTQALAASGK